MFAIIFQTSDCAAPVAKVWGPNVRLVRPISWRVGLVSAGEGSCDPGRGKRARQLAIGRSRRGAQLGQRCHTGQYSTSYFQHIFCRVTYRDQKAICQEVGLGFLHIALQSVVVCLCVSNIPVTILQMQNGQQIAPDRSQTNAITVTFNLLDGVH